MSDKDKRTVDFVISKFYGLSYQPNRACPKSTNRRHLDQGLVPRLQHCRENHGGVQRRSRGGRWPGTNEHSFVGIAENVQLL